MDAPYTRAVPPVPSIWKQGNARLLDFSQQHAQMGDAPVVLFVPSLINRYYILDLDEERSMLRYLASQGIYTLTLDWGEPGDFEREFDCKQYITEILLPAIEFVHKASGKPVTLAGYCMGGTLALAAAALAPKQVGKLALLATPWDFHCEHFAPFVMDERWHGMMEQQIKSQDTLPAHFIQSLFYWTEPWVFEQKFRRFAGLSEGSRAADEFVALEHWVNDGVAMTRGVAKECLIDWAQKNVLATGSWRIDAKAITPAQIKQPVFVAVPKNDHVVPRDCAMPLAHALPKAHVIEPAAGHVGMAVGARAKKELWQPFAAWMKQ